MEGKSQQAVKFGVPEEDRTVLRKRPSTFISEPTFVDQDGIDPNRLPAHIQVSVALEPSNEDLDFASLGSCSRWPTRIRICLQFN